MTRALSRAEVRAVDQAALDEFGLPGIVLMENAGRGAVDVLLQRLPCSRVVVCVGKGNNGGDGCVMARHLELRNVTVELVLFCDPAALTGDALINYTVAVRSGLPCRRWGFDCTPTELARLLAGADWIIDALLGTGAQGEIREPYLSAVAAMNDSGRRIFAVDLPSGMDCDSGRPLGACVRATATATFVARKLGFDAPGAEQWTGVVDVVDIGVPHVLRDRALQPR